MVFRSGHGWIPNKPLAKIANSREVTASDEKPCVTICGIRAPAKKLIVSEVMISTVSVFVTFAIASALQGRSADLLHPQQEKKFITVTERVLQL